MNKEYISNKELHIELILSKAQGRLTKKAEKSLILICKGVNKKFFYNDIDDKQDCLQEAMLSVFRFWINYDEGKTTNAFAFISEIAKRAHAKGWNKINKNRDMNISLDSIFEDDNSGWDSLS
jgi:hypothetical protein